jgi:hypothetical protein
MFKKEDLWAGNGHIKTSSLFRETNKSGEKHLMTLNGGDDSVPCLRDLFVPLVAQDPSEVTFAEVVFNDVRYWMILREKPFLQEFLTEFRLLADAYRKRQAFETIIEDAKNKNSKTAVSSAKYLIEEPWKGTTRKAKVERKKSAEAASSVFNEDIQRLREEGLLQ